MLNIKKIERVAEDMFGDQEESDKIITINQKFEEEP